MPEVSEKNIEILNRTNKTNNFARILVPPPEPLAGAGEHHDKRQIYCVKIKNQTWIEISFETMLSTKKNLSPVPSCAFSLMLKYSSTT